MSPKTCKQSPPLISTSFVVAVNIVERRMATMEIVKVKFIADMVWFNFL